MSNSSGSGNSSVATENGFMTWRPETFNVFLCATGGNILVGFPTNSWVLWLIVTGSREALFSEIFTLNLAALEVAYCLQSPLIILSHVVWKQRLSKYLFFFSGLIIFGRPLFQGCICVERYLAVVHPITFLRYRPERYRLGCLAVVWFLTFVGCSCCVLVSFSVLNKMLLLFMLVLLTLKSFCCLAVLQALRRPGPGGPGAGAGGLQHGKQRAFRIIVVNLVFNFANYLPVMVVIPLQDILSVTQFNTVYTLCFSVSVLWAFVQPIHFLLRAGKLQCIVEC